jgi:hypothetical protein
VIQWKQNNFVVKKSPLIVNQQNWQLLSKVTSGLSVVALVLLSGCGGGSDSPTPVPVVDKYTKVPTPTVTLMASDGITAVRNYPFLAADYSLKAYGFVEQEFKIEGKAKSYTIPAAGYPAVTTNATVATSDNPYRTRMMVYRPSDPAKFNGTVIVEWVNATNGWDTPIHWFEQKEMFLRKGYAYVGITNQNSTISGANGLKLWSPNRYGDFDVTSGGTVASEGLSNDIFSQTAKAVRAIPEVMGGMPVKKVIGVGESQSGSRGAAYFNYVHPLTGNIFDAGLVTQTTSAIRTDLSIPIIRIMTETEFRTVADNSASVQPDTAMFKAWFVTGSTHSNLTSLLPRAAQYVRDFNGRMIGDTCSISQNSRLPLTYAYNAATVALEKHIENGAALPTSPRPEYETVAPSGLKRDADGNALGGIRYPSAAVPVAMTSGVVLGVTPTGTPCGNLGGTYVPFTKAKLDSLYPTHSDYVSKVTANVNSLVTDGFILPLDAQDVIANANSSIYGYKLNCDGALCADNFLFPQKPSILNLRWHVYTYYLPDSALLLAPVDQAAFQIASGYNTTDLSMSRTYFSQAIALLQNYSNLIQAQAAAGTLSLDAATYLSGQASRLISELQKL